MIIACRGIHRDIGNDLAVDLYVDLIDTIVQLLVVVRFDAVVFQQAFLKLGLPRVIRGGIPVCRSVLALWGIPPRRRCPYPRKG